MTDVKIDLYNDQTWTTRDGHTCPISELEERHARNILRFLERNAVRFEFAHSIRLVRSLPEHMGEMAEMAVMDDIEADGRDPVGWMRSTPAYVAIREHVDRLRAKWDAEEGAF